MNPHLQTLRRFWDLKLAKLEESVKKPACSDILMIMSKARAAYLVDTAMHPPRPCPGRLTLTDISVLVDPADGIGNESRRNVAVYAANALVWHARRAATGAFSQDVDRIVNYFSDKPTESFLFANLVYPSLFGYFVFNDLIGRAFETLKATLECGYTEVGALMFSAFFNGFPHFQHSLFSKLFELLEHGKDSFHMGMFLAYLLQSVEYASRYLCKEHREIIRLVIEKYGDTDFLAEYFVKRVIQNGFEKYSLYDPQMKCPVGRQLVIDCFKLITEASDVLHKSVLGKKIAESVLKVDMSFVPLPSVLDNGGRYLVFGSQREFRLLLEVMGNEKAANSLDSKSMATAWFTLCHDQEEVKPDNVFLFSNFVNDFLDGCLLGPEPTYERFYRALTQKAVSNNVCVADLLDPENKNSAVVRTRPVFSKSQIYYLERRLTDHYQSIALRFEGLIKLQLSNEVLTIHSEVWDEYYTIHCRQVASELTARNSSLTEGFDSAVESFRRQGKSKALMIYIMFDLMEGRQSNEYHDLIRQHRVMERFRDIRASEERYLGEYCQLTGRRKAELDKLAIHLHELDERSLGDYCLELCAVIGMVSQIAQSTSPPHDLFDLFRYLYVKSGSNRFIPAVLSYFDTFRSSAHFRELCDEYSHIKNGFELAGKLMLQLATKNPELHDLLITFAQVINPSEGDSL